MPKVSFSALRVHRMRCHMLREINLDLRLQAASELITITKGAIYAHAFSCSSYLNPQWFCGGPRRRQVLQVSCPLIGEHRPGCLVLSVPLDRPAAVQEILAGVVTSQRQEIPGFGHLLNTDVPGSLWDQSDVYVAWGTLGFLEMKLKASWYTDKHFTFTSMFMRNIPSPSLSSNVFLTVVQVEPFPWQTPQRSSTAPDSIT